MSDTQQLYSSDQRFFLLLERSEIRMSHWITNTTLWESTPRRALLQLGDWSWSTEQASWHADSTCLNVELRRYPGDAPALLLDIYPVQRLIVPRTPADTAWIEFDGLEQYLERYYQRHRRATTETSEQG
jgi:hypothetical protein